MRQATLCLGLLACILLLRARGGGSELTSTTSPPSATPVTRSPLVDSSSYDEVDDEEGLVADAVEANLTAFGPIKLRREHLAMEPMAWRRNRKKVTELTSITSEKGEQSAGAGADEKQQQESGDAPDDELPVAGGTLNWLTQKWTAMRKAKAAARAAGFATSPQDELAAADVLQARRQRRSRRRVQDLCLELQRRHGVIPFTTWGSLPAGQIQSWQTLKCDEQVGRAAAAGRRGLPSDEGPAAETPMSGSERDRRRQQWQPPILGIPAVDGDGGGVGVVPVSTRSREECERMARRHSVIVGTTWGTLPDARRYIWTQLQCDVALADSARYQPTGSASMEAAVMAAQGPRRGRYTQPAEELRAGAWSAQRRGNQRDGRFEADADDVGDAHRVCRRLKRTYHVRPRSDWGTLPPEGQRKWTRLDCDRNVAG